MTPSIPRTRRGRPRPLPAVFVVSIGLLATACGPPAPVVQGTVVAIQNQMLTVQDETRPEGPPLALDIASAEIGNRPVVGDMVRVVYRQEGGGNRAIAVMNVTRQEQNEGKAP
ncbi:MAG: hypothetical protein AB1806_20325 [Acidobacteriota bacterium]